MRVTPQCDSVNSFVIRQTDSVQANPAVDFDGTNYVVAWEDNTSGDIRVLAARVTPGGSVLDAGNPIGETGADETFADIIFNGTEYFAVWCHYSAPFGVRARRVSTQALPLGSVINVANTVTYKYINPRIAFSGGVYLVVWADMASATNFDIYGQLVAPSGSLIGSRITISDDTSSEIQAYVVFDGMKFLVAWNDSGTIRGRYVETSGQVFGPVFAISSNNTRMHDSPWMAVSDSNILVTWEETAADKDVYGTVDITIGIAEDGAARCPALGSIPSVFSGPLNLPAGRKYTLYDITGCIVDQSALKPGVYFVAVDGRIRQKVVKIR